MGISVLNGRRREQALFLNIEHMYFFFLNTPYILTYASISLLSELKVLRLSELNTYIRRTITVKRLMTIFSTEKHSHSCFFVLPGYPSDVTGRRSSHFVLLASFFFFFLSLLL